MKDYRVGQYHNFWVKGLSGKVILLEDEKHDKFYVNAYDFQTEWDWASAQVPVQVLSCYVKGISINGVSLAQNREVLLKALYQEADSKETTVTVFIVDSVKQLGSNLYYILRDAYGLSHRYHPESPINVQAGDEIELDVVAINCDGQKSALELRPHDANLVQQTSEVAIVDDSNTGEFGEETNEKEFKSTIVYPAGATGADIDTQMQVIVKTIAGFMNAKGGTLYIGVNDNGDAVGIENEYGLLNSSKKDTHTYQANNDGYQNKIRSSMNYYLNPVAQDYVHITFTMHDNHIVCNVNVEASNKVIWFNQTEAYKRTGNRTSRLRSDAIVKLVLDKAGVTRPVTMNMAPVRVDSIDDVLPDSNETNVIEPISTDEVIKVAPPAKIPAKGAERTGRGSFYMNLFKNGEWSWSKEKPKSRDLEFCVPINAPTSQHFLVMVYDDGCVNCIDAFRLHKDKKEERRYSGGRRSDGATLLKAFAAMDQDMLACFSTQDNHPYVKVHYLSHISHFLNMSNNGNRVINVVGMDNVKMEDICFVPNEHAHRVSALLKTENQTANSLGFQMDLSKNITKYSQVVETLKAICDIQ